MSKFIIDGPNYLKGEIAVSGAKNAALKMIAACVLIQDQVILKNVPDILDIQTIIDILVKNGAEISRDKNTLTINTSILNDNDPDTNLVKKIRGSIVLIGPYLSRFKKINIPNPGGCVIGSRPINTQLDALEQLEVRISHENGMFQLDGSQMVAGEVELREASVSATEIAILSSVMLDGQTVIKNAACEPEIMDQADFLNKCGAKISGAGTKNIIIDGVGLLHGQTHAVIPDRIETATYACLAIVTKSQLKITHCRPDHLKSFLDKISQMGVKLKTGLDYIDILHSDNLKAVDITTAVYPDFATDIQAPMGLVLTQADGKSRITEKLFENRLGYLNELQKMGADIKILNNHEAVISGPTKLHGAKLESLDLRAGATMILAGAAAEGKTEIDEAQIIDRGYEKIEEKLVKIGVNIQRIS